MNASIHLLRRIVPSIVDLRIAIPHDHPSASLLGTERTATGTIVDPAGFVLTVHYAVIGAQAIQANLSNGRALPASVVAIDYASGLALLQLAEGGMPAVPLRSTADVAPGEEVFLVASVGDGGPRVSTGVVSHLGEFDAYWEYILERAMTATVMSPGAGGGAMIDLGGRMLGCVSLNLNEIGRLSLAIPVENYLDHRAGLIARGRRAGAGQERAWMGLFCHTLRSHVVVLGTIPGAPAGQADLRSGDVILAADGEPVSDRPELYRAIWRHRPGEFVELQIFRNNEVSTVRVPTSSIEEAFS